MKKSLKALTKTSDEACTAIKLLTFDIETINWTEPYAVGFYDGKEAMVFSGRNCIKDFLDEFLAHKYRGHVIYAHNGGKFDFSFVLKHLVTKDYMKQYILEPLRIGSRITQLTIRDRKGHKWIMKDSMALLKFSLKKLTDKFDVKHKKGDFEHDKINWRNWENLRSEWQPYLIDDCRGLYEVLQSYESYLIDKFDISLNKVLTIAQLALKIYRKKYLPHHIQTYKSVEGHIRGSYYGGRTEVFKQYGEELNYYDVNSLYPYVMAKHDMPVGSPLKSYIMTVDDFGVALCDVDCPKDLDIPLLPYRMKGKQGYKLVFPTGKFRGWFCTPELKKAEQLGYKIDIKFGYKFKKSKIFKPFIDDMYKIKQTAPKDSIDYLNSKLLMNSLYGKFGQRRETEQVILNPKSTFGLEPMDVWGELPFYIRKSESKSNHILPAIASFVTSYARLELYKLLENSDPYYCDTDSVVTRKKINTGDKIGELKLEMKIKKGVFILPKMYAVIDGENKEFVKCKGFPHGIIKFDMMKDALFSDDYSKLRFDKKKFASPFESLKRNKTFVSMIKYSRSVQTRYDKRTIVDKGKSLPLHLSIAVQ